MVPQRIARGQLVLPPAMVEQGPEGRVPHLLTLGIAPHGHAVGRRKGVGVGLDGVFQGRIRDAIDGAGVEMRHRREARFEAKDVMGLQGGGVVAQPARNDRPSSSVSRPLGMMRTPVGEDHGLARRRDMCDRSSSPWGRS
jgi:hypothetical protein